MIHLRDDLRLAREPGHLGGIGSGVEELQREAPPVRQTRDLVHPPRRPFADGALDAVAFGDDLAWLELAQPIRPRCRRLGQGHGERVGARADLAAELVVQVEHLGVLRAERFDPLRELEVELVGASEGPMVLDADDERLKERDEEEPPARASRPPEDLAEAGPRDEIRKPEEPERSPREENHERRERSPARAPHARGQGNLIRDVDSGHEARPRRADPRPHERAREGEHQGHAHGEAEPPKATRFR